MIFVTKNWFAQLINQTALRRI